MARRPKLWVEREAFEAFLAPEGVIFGVNLTGRHILVVIYCISGCKITSCALTFR